MSRNALRLTALATAALLVPEGAHAAALDGAALRWPWALPFLGILLTIATGPLLFPRIWHGHYGKLAIAWAALTLAAVAAHFGFSTAVAAFAHIMLADYMSFILLLFSLYVVAGGILMTGNLRGTPLVNTLLLAMGTAAASVIGTTGAAMVLIRPLLHANAPRLHNVHVVVFFIFLVANIGGALSPLGDPPLFVGFLRGVDFFWTAQQLWAPTLLTATTLLALFLALDLWLYRKDQRAAPIGDAPLPLDLRLRGGINVVLIAAIIATILGAAAWQPGIEVEILGTPLALQNLMRDGALLTIAVLSLVLTPNEHREANGFSWEPIREVAILFAGIFTCIIPVLAMLAAEKNGAFAWLFNFVTSAEGDPHNVSFFWLTGILSAVLDNAPTYLVFFELAGGDARELMGELAPTLKAISMGAVYMGALTYVGNAPNLMIYAIAVERGVRMPSFFGYLGWSSVVLVPIFVLLTFLFVRV